jgi:cytochrome b subunit of formate dehydrogenase/cytochrome c553
MFEARCEWDHRLMRLLHEAPMKTLLRSIAACLAGLVLLSGAYAADDKDKEKYGATIPGPVLADPAKAEETYRLSIHAKKNADDPTKLNASCTDCHGSDQVKVIAPGTPEYAARRLADPARCGKCHEEHIEEYKTSSHGKANTEKKDKAAVCSDCHNSHGIDRTNTDAAKLGAVKACATCHKENAETYGDSYHGQVTTLGYTTTAKCFNCHGSHGIQGLDNPKSKIHPANRLETCRECHKEANANFVKFEPHATSRDFKKYPEVTIATNFMVGLLAGTFAFFWVHLMLWLYRELKDRKEGKGPRHIRAEELGIAPGKRVRRFGPWWRIGHLTFALTVMVLTLTGMSLLYADTVWAPVVVKALGGFTVAGIIHRVAAVIFTIVFVIHLIYMLQYMWFNRKTFKWFGPDSLIANWQDLWDAVAMFKWFFGKGPRPVFERWTYYEKFDYWAPFWGVTIVGVTGFVMWFPNLVSNYLPGWVFNVAIITHAEEAFLAAVFLFTVHFFNNHFRPDKFPFDDVMFTGAMPIEEFAREHTLQYRRLVETGQLEKYLVDAPTRTMYVGSRILGFVLISCGLTLLLLITNGFFRGILN